MMSPSGAPTIGEALVTPTPRTAPSATPRPSSAEPTLAVDTFAQVVTTDLVVRTAPGTGPDSEEIPGRIAHHPVYIVDGPVRADGYEWWLIVPDEWGGIGGMYSPGWVAAGGDSEVWLAPASRHCEPNPSSEELWAMSLIERVGCYAGTELTLRGVLFHCAAPADRPDYCGLRYCPPTQPDYCGAAADIPTLALRMEPPSDRLEGRLVVTGHFADPAAEECGRDQGWRAGLAVFACKTEFHVTEYRFTD